MFFESNLTESKVKKTFDDIYWKCPDLIPQIVLSFRHLYIKNIQKFEKYIEGINAQIKDNFVRGEKSLLDDYNHLIGRKGSFISKNNIILDFYNQNKDIDEYTDEKVDEIINRLYTGETRDNIIETIKKLYYSLIEYKNYLKYKDLIDKAKKLYGETLEKDYLKNTLKKINKLEQELFKLNKKSSNKVTKTSVDKLEPAINSKIGEIKALYDEIDEKLFLIIIKTYIKDNSTIFKVLLLICQHYKVLADYFLEGDPNLSYSQIDSKIDELISFTLSPNNTLINNITLLEKQELSDIIVTNYKLLNINVEESFSSPEALDSLIGDLEKILINDKMKLLEINVEDLKDAKAIKALEL